MKQACEHCNKETEGYQMTVNGVKLFICLTCKQEQLLIEAPKETSCGVVYKCGGFYSTDNRRK